MIKKVKKRIERNPRRSANQMAKDLKISRERMLHILKNELMLKPYKIQKALDLTPQRKSVRLRLAERGQIEQFTNSQNDRVYLTERMYDNLSSRLVIRKHKKKKINENNLIALFYWFLFIRFFLKTE